MKSILLIVIGFALTVSGAFYWLFAPVRVAGNIDSYEQKLRPIIVENVDSERYAAREYDLDGLLHPAREGWSRLETTAILLLISGLAVSLLGFLGVMDGGNPRQGRTNRRRQSREAGASQDA